MINLIKKFMENYESREEAEGEEKIGKSEGEKKHFISDSLTETLAFFQNKFTSSEDLTIRKLQILNLDSALYYSF